MNSYVSKLKAYFAVFIALGLSACATPLKSSVDVADNVYVGKFKTFAWVTDQPQFASSPGGDRLVNPVNQGRVRATIEQELNRKGYRQVSLDQADLVVGFTLGARDRAVVRDNFSSFGYRRGGFYNGFNGGFGRFGLSNSYGVSRFGVSRFGFNRFGGHRGGHLRSRFSTVIPATTIRTYTEGTLVVNFFDNREKEAIWHGMASKRLSGDGNGADLISEAVWTLLEEFPDSAEVAAIMGDEVSS